MNPLRLARSFARPLALLLLALAIPAPAASQTPAAMMPRLAPEARARLSHAAASSRLLPWQRDFMLRLAAGGDPAAAGPAAGAAIAAGDGTWSQLLPGRTGHSAIYDPVRDRMLVFGGSDGDYRNDVWALSLSGTPAWAALETSGTPPVGRAWHTAIYDPVRDRMIVFGGLSTDWSHSYYYNDVWALSLSGTPTWTALTPAGTPPTARQGHSAIYDPLRDRMLVFGGERNYSYYDQVWALSLSGTPAWAQLTPAGTPPKGRCYHDAVYDPVRDRMVIFGGEWYDSPTFNFIESDEVWSLSLSVTPAWSQWTPAGTPPDPRYSHRAIYDPARDRVVVLGHHEVATVATLDAWSLSLGEAPTWTDLAPTGPDPGTRGSPSAIYDPARDRMVIFGGSGEGGAYLGDVWAMALGGAPAWAALALANPPPAARYDHSAIYDPVLRRMVIFGGSVNSDLMWTVNDVAMLWLGGTSAWTPLTPSGTPPSARMGHSAIYDPVRNRMIVFGGCSYVASWHYYNDVWALSLSGTPTWTALETSGTPPVARAWHTAIYDPIRDRMVVFGGEDLSVYYGDVWSLSLAGTPAWTALTPSGTPPSARGGHSAIYDPLRDRMVVFGGASGFGSMNDCRTLSLSGAPAWTLLTPSGTPPSARSGHSAIYDPQRDRMVVFGGGDPNGCWSLSLSGTPAWTALAPAGTAPTTRGGQSAVYDPVRDRMVLYGGAYTYECFGNVRALQWGTTLAAPDPGARPLVTCLLAPAPNPARGSTTVGFALSRAGSVRLGVYDLGGRRVRTLVDGERRAGTGTVVWNGRDDTGTRLGAGIYWILLETPEARETRKVVLVR